MPHKADEGTSEKKVHMEGLGCMVTFNGCAHQSPASCAMTVGASQGIKLSSWPHLTMLAYCTAAGMVPAASFRGGEGARLLFPPCRC